MRVLPCLALLLAVTAPGAALAQEEAGPESGNVMALPPDPALTRANKGECRKLGKKIVHYTRVAERAEERDDELWLQSTVAHVDRLEERWNTMSARRPARARPRLTSSPRWPRSVKSGKASPTAGPEGKSSVAGMRWAAGTTGSGSVTAGASEGCLPQG